MKGGLLAASPGCRQAGKYVNRETRKQASLEVGAARGHCKHVVSKQVSRHMGKHSDRHVDS